MSCPSETYSEPLAAQASHSSTSSTASASSTSTTTSIDTSITTPGKSVPLRALIDKLAELKVPFLDEVEAKVKSRVTNTSQRELASVIEKDGYSVGNDRKHSPAPDCYVLVFGCFIAKKTYHGHDLDSALSEPLAHIVSECYRKFIVEQQIQIAEHFLKKIVDDHVLRNTVLGYAADELLRKGVNKGRNKIVATLSHSFMAHAAHTHVALAIHHGVMVATYHAAVTVGATAGTAAVTLLAAWILKAIATHVGVTMAKVLHGQALHGLAAVLSHKIGMAACAGVIVNLLVTHLGAAGATTVVHVSVPPLAAFALWIIYKRIPESMGKRVAKGVRDELSGEFRSLTETILRDLAKDIFSMDALGKAIANGIFKMENWQGIFEGVDISGFPGLDADMATNVSNLNDIRRYAQERIAAKDSDVEVSASDFPCQLCTMSMAGVTNTARNAHVLECLRDLAGSKMSTSDETPLLYTPSTRTSCQPSSAAKPNTHVLSTHTEGIQAPNALPTEVDISIPTSIPSDYSTPVELDVTKATATALFISLCPAIWASEREITLQ